VTNHFREPFHTTIISFYSYYYTTPFASSQSFKFFLSFHERKCAPAGHTTKTKQLTQNSLVLCFVSKTLSNYCYGYFLFRLLSLGIECNQCIILRLVRRYRKKTIGLSIVNSNSARNEQPAFCSI
jgi:hypothetical protein